LTGMLARLDIFRTIATESPDWDAIGARNVVVSGIRHIKDIMRRDIHTVKADASLEEIMKVIDYNDIQRVAVVDETGKLIGLIFDRDLLRLFSKHKVGLWDRIASKFTFSELGRRHKAVVDQAAMKTAGDLMQTEIVTAREDATIDEAIRVMTERHIKRLPVVDAEGRFQGMVSRDSLLRVIMDGYQTER